MFKNALLNSHLLLADFLIGEGYPVKGYNDPHFLHECLMEAEDYLGVVLVDYLSKKGVDMNSQQKGSWESPLHIAVKRQMLETVKALLSMKVDVNSVAKGDAMPLILAMAAPNTATKVDIMDMLIAAGARTTWRTDGTEMQATTYDQLNGNTFSSSGRITNTKISFKGPQHAVFTSTDNTTTTTIHIDDSYGNDEIFGKDNIMNSERMESRGGVGKSTIQVPSSESIETAYENDFGRNQMRPSNTTGSAITQSSFSAMDSKADCKGKGKMVTVRGGGSVLMPSEPYTSNSSSIMSSTSSRSVSAAASGRPKGPKPKMMSFRGGSVGPLVISDAMISSPCTATQPHSAAESNTDTKESTYTDDDRDNSKDGDLQKLANMRISEGKRTSREAETECVGNENSDDKFVSRPSVKTSDDGAMLFSTG
jgi:ankyrin repeat protein